MGSDALTKMLLKSLLPTVQKFVESGKIDSFFQELKRKYQPELSPENSIDILLTTEADGNEYVNIVELTSQLRIVRVVSQERLSALLTSLFTQANM